MTFDRLNGEVMMSKVRLERVVVVVWSELEFGVDELGIAFEVS